MGTFFKILLVSLLIITGCEKPSSQDSGNKIKNPGTGSNKNTNADSSLLIPKIFKGIYSKRNQNPFFFDCNSKRTFSVAAEGEITQIENLYSGIRSDKNDPKLYVEIEGFISERSGKKNSVMDTVLIITKYLKSDLSPECR